MPVRQLQPSAACPLLAKHSIQQRRIHILGHCHNHTITELEHMAIGIVVSLAARGFSRTTILRHDVIPLSNDVINLGMDTRFQLPKQRTQQVLKDVVFTGMGAREFRRPDIGPTHLVMHQLHAALHITAVARFEEFKNGLLVLLYAHSF